MLATSGKGHVLLTCSASSRVRVLTSVSESQLHENILQNIFAFQATANEVAKTPGATRLNHSYLYRYPGQMILRSLKTKFHRRIH